MTKTANKIAPLFTGRGKQARETAMNNVASLSFHEAESRAALVASLDKALGSAPTEAQLAHAQQQTIAGRVASRLPLSDFPKDKRDEAGRIEFALLLLTRYAAPPAEGAKARKLRAGQLGRRTMVQHKAIRAADKHWCEIKAELGFSSAQTQKENTAKKEKAKRAPHRNAKATDKAKSAAPTHSELVKAPAKMTKPEVCAYVETQAAALLASANKLAALMPTDYGMAISAFHKAIAAASAARREREEKAEAVAAAKSK